MEADQASTSDFSDIELDLASTRDTGPESSGCTSYMKWLVRDRLTALEQRALCTQADYKYLDYCSGFGTALLVSQALSIATNTLSNTINGGRAVLSTWGKQGPF